MESPTRSYSFFRFSRASSPSTKVWNAVDDSVSSAHCVCAMQTHVRKWGPNLSASSPKKSPDDLVASRANDDDGDASLALTIPASSSVCVVRGATPDTEDVEARDGESGARSPFSLSFSSFFSLLPTEA